MPVQRVDWKKCERLKPSVRARRIIERVSRDKWISPNEARRIARRITHVGNAINAATFDGNLTGILRGRPVFFLFEPGYNDARLIVSNEKDPTIVMIKLLKLMERKLK